MINDYFEKNFYDRNTLPDLMKLIKNCNLLLNTNLNERSVVFLSWI